MQVFISSKLLWPLSIHEENISLILLAILKFSDLPKYPKFSPMPCAVNHSPEIATVGFCSICFILPDKA